MRLLMAILLLVAGPAWAQDTTRISAEASIINLGGNARLLEIDQNRPNWRDSTGAWKKFTPRIRAAVYQDYDFVHDEAAYTFRADKDLPQWALTYGSVGIAQRPLNVNAGFTTGRTDEQVFVRNAWDSTDIEINLTPEGTKEDVILKSRAAPDSFRFGAVLAGATPNVQSGGIQFGPLYLPKPTATDATGADVPVTIGWRYVAPSTYTLTLRVDTAGATYPITIDPTITIAADSANMVFARSNDATYNTARGQVTADVVNLNTNPPIGQLISGDYYIDRVFIWWPLTTYSADTMAIDSVRLNCYGNGDASTTDFVVHIYSGYQQTGIDAYTGIVNDFDGWQTGTTAYNGSLLSNSYNSSAYVNAAYGNLMVFSAAGEDTVAASLGDTLKLVLISKEDVDASAPTGDEYVQITTKTANQRPKLEIYYHYQTPPSSIVSSGSRGTVLYERNPVPGYVRPMRAISETKKAQ